MGINYHQNIPKETLDRGNAGIVLILPCCSLLKIPGGVGNPGLDLGIKGIFLLFSNPSGCAGNHKSREIPAAARLDEAGILDFGVGFWKMQQHPSLCSMEKGAFGIPGMNSPGYADPSL